MKQYAGLDVSLKEISICVVDRDGKIIARGSTIADPEAIVDFFAEENISPQLMVHESGPLSRLAMTATGSRPAPRQPNRNERKKRH